MRRARAGLGVAVVVAMLAPAGAVPAGERVPLHGVPRPVLDAVARRFAGGRVAAVDRDRDDRGVLYEVSVRDGGRTLDVTVTPEGAILLIKVEIAAADLPGPVREAVARAHPGAGYAAVEAVTVVQGRRETLAYYEIDLLTAGRRLVEVRVGVDGRVQAAGAPPRETPR